MITDHQMRRVLVTGGAGFIGSAVCRLLVKSGVNVLNIDKLTYAGNLDSLRELDAQPNYLRIPTKSARYSNSKPATYSDLKPAGVPTRSRPPGNALKVVG